VTASSGSRSSGSTTSLNTSTTYTKTDSHNSSSGDLRHTNQAVLVRALYLCSQHLALRQHHLAAFHHSLHRDVVRQRGQLDALVSAVASVLQVAVLPMRTRSSLDVFGGRVLASSERMIIVVFRLSTLSVNRCSRR
jgi:hypothetical protein